MQQRASGEGAELSSRRAAGAHLLGSPPKPLSTARRSALRPGLRPRQGRVPGTADGPPRWGGRRRPRSPQSTALLRARTELRGAWAGASRKAARSPAPRASTAGAGSRPGSGRRLRPTPSEPHALPAPWSAGGPDRGPRRAARAAASPPGSPTAPAAPAPAGPSPRFPGRGPLSLQPRAVGLVAAPLPRAVGERRAGPRAPDASRHRGGGGCRGERPGVGGSGRGCPPQRAGGLGPRAYPAGPGLEPARRGPPGSAGVRWGSAGLGRAASCSGDARRPPAPPPPASGYVAPRGASREAGGGAGCGGGTSAFTRRRKRGPRLCRRGRGGPGAVRGRSGGGGGPGAGPAVRGRERDGPGAGPAGRGRGCGGPGAGAGAAGAEAAPAAEGTAPGRLGHRGRIRKARRGPGSQGGGTGRVRRAVGATRQGRDRRPPPHAAPSWAEPSGQAAGEQGERVCGADGARRPQSGTRRSRT